MRNYSVKELAQLAGVSVRTLHHYDRLGLLKPLLRTDACYRLYGEAELIRLQQILFYRELDFSLADIADLLNDPNFNVLKALESHKLALQARQFRLVTLLTTIDKTIATLKNEQIMLTDDELYAGFAKGKAYRQEAADHYGEVVVAESEAKLRQLGKAGFDQLKADQQNIMQTLLRLVDYNPTDPAVQQQIARHYANIRGFWGESVCASKDMQRAYKGLAQLYLDDLRFTRQNGQDNPAFARFLYRAMCHFADEQLSTK